MKAMILAAGRGDRLRPLTDTLPKPLIEVDGKALIEYHLQNLAGAGIEEVIINTAWLAEKIHARLGDGSRYGIRIRYSDEGEALETAGGIINALPLLGDEPFLVVNGDIYCDFQFSALNEAPDYLDHHVQAHLILVDNPQHNVDGDFALDGSMVRNSGQPMYTFSGIGVYSPAFFADHSGGTKPLAPLLRTACDADRVSGRYHPGHWTDVGTLERLQQLEQQLLR